MLKFAICDDEPQMVQQLTEALTQYLKETQIAAFSVSRFSSGAALLDSGGESYEERRAQAKALLNEAGYDSGVSLGR